MKKTRKIYLAMFICALYATTAKAAHNWHLKKINGEWLQVNICLKESRDGCYKDKDYDLATSHSVSKINAAINKSNKNITSNNNVIKKNTSDIQDIYKQIEKTKKEILVNISFLENHMTNESNLIVLKEQIKAELKRELGL